MAKSVVAKKTVKKAAPKKSPAKKTVAKKIAVKKTGAPKKANNKDENKALFKYEDKSKGQPRELVTIWEKIKALLLPYEKGIMKIHGGSGGQITLINHKPFEIDGRKRPEYWFASALIQKGYVGFYFMPAYTSEEIKKIFKPELLACLKGKSCFHIKKDDPQLYAQIKESLKLGYDSCRKKGWI